MPECEYTTEDMALVAYLRCREFSYARMLRAGKGCSWVFKRSDSLDRAVMDYTVDSARVRPKEFAVVLSVVRREMYTFLNIDPRLARH